MMERLCEQLHSGGHTLVVRSSDGDIRCFKGRGVSDLYRLYNVEPDFLKDAEIADKVVGRAAAALMILGGVKRVHTDVISGFALSLFGNSDVEVGFDVEVPHIINRSGDGWCPLETRCKNCSTPEECYIQIESFMKELK